MEDILASILNSGIAFNNLLAGIVGYLAVLWLAFSVWVFVDARKRYAHIATALVIAAVVFILNFPALILYLIVRPEEDMDMHHADHWQGGVQVPIVRFVDDKGDIKLALNLQVSPKWNPKSDMNIEIAWDSEREDINVQHPAQQASPVAKVVENTASSELPSTQSPKGRLAGLKARALSIGKIKLRKKKSAPKESPEQSSDTADKQMEQ